MNKRLASRKRRQLRRVSMEALESRRLLTCDATGINSRFVEGTLYDDLISISEAPTSIGNTGPSLRVAVHHPLGMLRFERTVHLNASERLVVCGLDGNDQIGNSTTVGVTLEGGLGDDRLDGGGGADWLVGGDGNDSLYGWQGDDTLVGGDGDDRLEGQAGDDYLDGGIGDDVLIGDVGNDRLDGGDGVDWLYGDTLTPDVYPGDSPQTDLDDILYGGDDNNFLYGGFGDDLLYGGPERDEIYGGHGNDRLEGGNDADCLYGQEGDDLLIGGFGGDFLEGGEGSDDLYGSYPDLTRLDPVVHNDRLFGDNQDGSGSGDDHLYGGSHFNNIHGGLGNDLLVGSDYAPNTGVPVDELFGGPGADHLIGRDGFDALDGGDQGDVLRGGIGDDYLLGGGGDDIIFGDQGADFIDGDAGNDWLMGGSTAPGVDACGGGMSVFNVWRARGATDQDDNDIIRGGPGHDVLIGDLGNDTLNGDGGDDILFDGPGVDLMDGGEGFDVAFYSDRSSYESMRNIEAVLPLGVLSYPTSESERLEAILESGSPSLNPWDPLASISLRRENDPSTGKKALHGVVELSGGFILDIFSAGKWTRDVWEVGVVPISYIDLGDC